MPCKLVNLFLAIEDVLNDIPSATVVEDQRSKEIAENSSRVGGMGGGDHVVVCFPALGSGGGLTLETMMSPRADSSCRSICSAKGSNKLKRA